VKVFYTTSLRRVSEDRELLQHIYSTIERLGYTNLDTVLFNISNEKQFYSGSRADRLTHFDRMVDCITKADVIVLEVSLHSLSLGFILHKSLILNKPVIALYAQKRVPFFIQGVRNKKLQVLEYRPENLDEVVEEALSRAKNVADTRFDFFISAEIGSYLDMISRERRISRAAYVRGLIENDMQKQGKT